MAERERLPNRRAAEIIDFEHGGRRWTACIGRFGDGRLAEIFLSGPKVSALAEMAAESGIIASIGLQSGVALETLRHALSGRDIGPLARALELVGGSP